MITRTCYLPALHNKRVRVYRNLQQNCFSVQLNGLVVLHTDSLILERVKFVVSLAGRARAIREKRKNVHAFVEGTFNVHLNKIKDALDHETGREASYNPYDGRSFGAFRNRHGEIVWDARYAVLRNNRVYVDPTDLDDGERVG